MSNTHFLSYCTDNSNIANLIDKDLSRAGYDFQHHNWMGDQHGNLLDKMLQSSGKIFLLISDNFLKSQTCMENALSFIQDSRLSSRILPVIIDGRFPDETNGSFYYVPTKFDRVSNVIRYMNHWQDEYLELRKQKRDIESEDLDAYNNQVQKIRTISSEIGEFLRHLRVMEYAHFVDFKNNQYKKFFEFAGELNAPKHTQYLSLPEYQASETSIPATEPESNIIGDVAKAAGITTAVGGVTSGLSGLMDKATEKVEETKDSVLETVEEVTENEAQTLDDLTETAEENSSAMPETTEVPEVEIPSEDLPDVEESLDSILEGDASDNKELTDGEEMEEITPEIDLDAVPESEVPEPAAELTDGEEMEEITPEVDLDAVPESEVPEPAAELTDGEEMEEVTPEVDLDALVEETVEEAMPALERSIPQDEADEFGNIGSSVPVEVEDPSKQTHETALLEKIVNYKEKESKEEETVEEDYYTKIEQEKSSEELVEDVAADLTEKLSAGTEEITSDEPSEAVYLDMADMALAGNDYEKAEENYINALSINSMNAVTYIKWSQMAAQQNTPDKALKILKKGKKATGNDPLLCLHYARGLNQAGQIAAAKKEYIKAVRSDVSLWSEDEMNNYGFDKKEVAKIQLAVAGHILEEESTNPEVKTILITGGTSGIGKAIAEKFASEGHRVIITGRRKKRLAAIKNNLSNDYESSVKALHFDVRKPLSVVKALNSLGKRWRDVDILINNAGLAKGFAPIHKGNLEHWEEMIDTNIKGLLYVTRVVAPRMVKRKSGHIINISSSAGTEVYPKGNVYCATKHAVDALTKGMRLDLHKHNIRVTSISPGHVETEFALVRFDGDKDKAKIYEDFQPLMAEDVANAVYYAATTPEHVNIQDVSMFSSQQANNFVINRSGRNKE